MPLLREEEGRIVVACSKKEVMKKVIGSPLDPEHMKASAGVVAIAVKDLALYAVPDPTDDYRDAEATGRCKIVCTDLGGCTLACANIYGWTGGTVGSKEAARTDDTLTIVRMQFKQLPPGPKLICGDFNGPLEAFPTAGEMLKDEGWTDIGNDAKMCGGKPGQHTCHANANVKESRISYFLTNDRLTPAVTACWIERRTSPHTDRYA